MSTTKMVTRMAEVLAGAKVDPGDERACIRALQDAGFRIVDIVCDGDAARTLAKANAEVSR